MVSPTRVPQDCLSPGMYTVVYRYEHWLALNAARVQKHLLTKGTAGKRPGTF